MKNLLMGTAMIFVYMMILVMSFDSKIYLEEIKEIKLVTKELSATGSLFLEYDEFAQGSIEFKDEESIKAINGQIKSFMQLDDQNKPLENSYWQEQAKYKIYFYDNSGICRVYSNGIYEKQFNFNYPYLHNDELSGYKKTIIEPTVITTVNAGKPRSRLIEFQNFMNGLKVIKSSSYSWSEYN